MKKYSKNDHAFTRRWAKRMWLIEKMGGSCRQCDNDDAFVLEFHHYEDKGCDISYLLGKDVTWSALEEEAKKFSLLCVNCHRSKMSHITRECIKLKEKMVEYKGVNSCLDCGIKFEDIDLSAVNFHHNRDKCFKVGQGIRLVNKGELDFNVLVNEIDKCVVICSNCHRIRHTDILRFNKLKSLIYSKMKNKKVKNWVDRDLIVSLREQGFTHKEIASRVGCAYSCVGKNLRAAQGKKYA